MTDPIKQRRRRRLLLAGLLPLLLALAFTAKVAVMLAHDSAGRGAYAAQRYADARDSFAANGTLNHLESWVSPYDEGTARYRVADFSGAVRSLVDALASAPPEEECRVRINLGLAHEAVGDAAAAGGDREAARESWVAGVRALADGGCLELTSSDLQRVDEEASLRSRVRAAVAVDRRLDDKLRQQADDPSSTAEESEAERAADRLEQRNQQAEKDRRERRQLREEREAEKQREAEQQREDRAADP